MNIFLILFIPLLITLKIDHNAVDKHSLFIIHVSRVNPDRVGPAFAKNQNRIRKNECVCTSTCLAMRICLCCHTHTHTLSITTLNAMSRALKTCFSVGVGTMFLSSVATTRMGLNVCLLGGRWRRCFAFYTNQTPRRPTNISLWTACNPTHDTLIRVTRPFLRSEYSLRVYPILMAFSLIFTLKVSEPVKYSNAHA